jgi:hypothetical protein
MLSALHTPAVLGRRVCAVLAVCSAVLHGVMVGHAGNVVLAALILAMMAACLYCARDLWVEGSLGAWGLVAAMNLGMIVVHCSLPVHQHGTPLAIGVVAPMPTVMTLAIAISAVEVVVASAVLYRHSRERARSVIV